MNSSDRNSLSKLGSDSTISDRILNIRQLSDYKRPIRSDAHLYQPVIPDSSTAWSNSRRRAFARNVEILLIFFSQLHPYQRKLAYNFIQLNIKYKTRNEKLLQTSDRVGNFHSVQGWVDYKLFVVRYNYSYFKNMQSATTTATFEQKQFATDYSYCLKNVANYFATQYFLILLYNWNIYYSSGCNVTYNKSTYASKYDGMHLHSLNSCTAYFIHAN